MRAIRERFAGGRFAPRVEDLPPIALVGEHVDVGVAGLGRTTRRWCSGRPTSTSPAPWSPAARPNQLRSWTVRGDVTPYLDAFAMLGPLPSADLTE